MKTFLISFRESISIIKSDKIIILLGLIPFFIGMILYYFLSSWLFNDVLVMGKAWIESSVSSGIFGDFLGYLMTGLFSVFLFFLINWTFVILVSIIAGPFNDLISERVEKRINKETPEDLSISISRLIRDFLSIIINEVKKIGFIISVTLVAFIISWIPILVPFSFLITALLFAVEFVDYSWSRNNLTFKECLTDIKKSFLSYSIAGAMFLFIMAIPVVNIAMFPFGVIYFTVLYVFNNKTK